MTYDFSTPDAVAFNGQHYWFFSGDRCVRTNFMGDKSDTGVISILDKGEGHPSAWPILTECGDFQKGHFDAVVFSDHGGSGYWFFKGGRCAKISSDGEKVIHPPASVYGGEPGDRWPVLENLKIPV